MKTYRTNCPSSAPLNCILHQYGGIIFITLLGAGLRLYHLGYQSLWYDEANTLFFTYYVCHPHEIIDANINTDAALFIVLTWVWKHFAFGIFHFSPVSMAHDFVLRLLPCLFSIACIPASFFMAKSVLNLGNSVENKNKKSTALQIQVPLITATLVAISPFHLFYAQELRNYSLMTLLAIFVLWSLANALKQNSHRNWSLLGFFLALSFWNHFFALWLFLITNLFIIFYFNFKIQHLFKWAFWQFVALVFCLPAILQAYNVSKIINRIKGQWMPGPDFKTIFITFKTFFTGYSLQSWAYWPLFFLTLTLFLFGISMLYRQKKFACLILLWTWFPIIANVVLWGSREFSYYELRLFLFSSITAAMGVAIGLSYVPRIPRIVLFLLITLLSLPGIVDYYDGRIHPVQHHRLGVRHKVDNREAAIYVGTHMKDDEIIAHFSHITMQPFRIYQPALKQTHICLNNDNIQGFFDAFPNETMWQRLGLVPELAEDVLKGIDSFWFIISWWEPFDLPPSLINIQEWFEKDYNIFETRHFYGIDIVHYRRKQKTISSSFSSAQDLNKNTNHNPQ